MKTNSIIILAIMAIVASGCTERIDLSLENQKFARLVVEGEFSTDTTAHRVKLSVTGDYYNNAPAPVVSNANITISSDDEFYQLTESQETPGLYLTANDVFGTVGKEYLLSIDLEEEIGGSKNYTATSVIYPINQLDSIGLKFQEDWGDEGFWEVKCYVWDPPTEDFYMFHIYRNGILINDTLDEVFVVDDLLYNGNYTNGIGVGFLNQGSEDEKLLPGDTVTLRVARITKDYSEFIFRLQEEISYSSPLFSGPPANVHGNISGGAFGAFGAYSATYSSAMAPEIPN
jgi:hypothetical protein